MKISASIYSDKKRPLKEVIKDLVDHQIEVLHIDCNDDLSVFNDIAEIRLWCSIPIDLHIITDEPDKYFDFLKKHPVEYLTFQYESLKSPLKIPDEIKSKKGIAITTPTDIGVFSDFEDMDFILIMATTPGQSGGDFDQNNFSKIRKYRAKYPKKSIHVDGGVNAEVSFILRNMGVSLSVSGSYLFSGSSIGNSLMNLTQREIESNYCVGDFMTPLEETPHINYLKASTKTILECVENGNMGVAIICEENGELRGIVSSADIRKALLKNIDQPSIIKPDDLINRFPISIGSGSTVVELLQLVKSCTFPIMYLPVVDELNNAVGIINFVHLIKGEI